MGLLGCGVATGLGAVFNTAKVEPGSAVAVFGIGTVGLAVIEAAVQVKCREIIAIDTNPSKFKLAEKWGATKCLNPKDQTKPIQVSVVNNLISHSTVPAALWRLSWLTCGGLSCRSRRRLSSTLLTAVWITLSSASGT